MSFPILIALIDWSTPLGVAVILITAVLTVWGSAMPPASKLAKWLFALCGLALGVLLVLQMRENDKTQGRLQAQLNKIQKQTEQPPQVTVNPQIQVSTALPPEHTHVDYLNPGQAPQPTPPGIPFRVNEESGFNVGFVNVGDYPVNDCESATAAYVQRATMTSDRVFAKFIKDRKLRGCASLMPRSNKYTYQTEYTHKLSESDIRDLQEGKLVIFALGRVKWRDATGHYLTESCSFLASNMPREGTFTWHTCGTHNREVKIF